MEYKVTPQLVKQLTNFRAHEKEGILERQAMSVLGSSVIRVFRKKSKPLIRKSLLKIRIDEFGDCRTQKEFDRLFFKALKQVDTAILKKNKSNTKVGISHKWGHAAKITCLFLRGIVLHSHYFSQVKVKRLVKFLYVPVDRVVLDKLRECDVAVSPKGIKDVNSRDEFEAIQGVISQAAAKANCPRVLFDDAWSARDA